MVLDYLLGHATARRLFVFLSESKPDSINRVILGGCESGFDAAHVEEVVTEGTALGDADLRRYSAGDAVGCSRFLFSSNSDRTVLPGVVCYPVDGPAGDEDL